MSVNAIIGKADAELITCKSDDLLKDVVGLMVGHNENAVAVVADDKKEHLVGILTDHDVMLALNQEGLEFKSALVGDWMSRKVVTCSADAKFTTALKLMGQHGIRHIVVVEGHRPLAVLGIRAVLSTVHEHDEMEISVLRDMAVAGGASFSAHQARG